MPHSTLRTRPARTLRPALPLARSAILSVTLFLAAPGLLRADPLQDAQRFLKQGQHTQALERVDAQLSARPKDVQARFLKAVILSETGRVNEAVALYARLTEDHPELPEPYNNLAVLYVQQKQYDKAKSALEKALRTHPSYAAAHDNLVDIYTNLARQAYDKALNGETNAQQAVPPMKLAQLRDLVSVNARAGALVGTTQVAAAPPAAPPPAKPAIPPQTATVTPPHTAPATPAKPAATANAPATATLPPPPPPVVAAVPNVSGDSAKHASTAGNSAGDSGEVARAVQAWAAAWSKKDVKSYLAAYAKDFRTPDGEPRKAWESERARRIDKPGKIEVHVEHIKVDMQGADEAIVRFRQNYRSAGFKSSAGKTLVLVKSGNKWLIQQERVGQ